MSIDNLIKSVLELIDNKKFDEALNFLQKIDKEDSRVYFLKGTIYLAQKKMELAEKNLIIAGKLNDKNFSIFHNLGIIYEIKGDIESAKTNFLKAIKINGNIESLSEIGKIFLNENNFQQAQKYFEEVLKKDNEHRRTNIRLGNMYLKMDEHKKGWSHIHKATGLIRFSEKGVEII